MIQRRQSLYLLVSFVSLLLSLVTNLVYFTANGEETILSAFTMKSGADMATIVPIPWMGILISIAALIPFVTIFLFKKRMLQVRLCIIETIIILGVIAYVLIYFFTMRNSLMDLPYFAFRFGVGFFTPYVALVTTPLAIRNILQDEMLIRSLNRIR